MLRNLIYRIGRNRKTTGWGVEFMVLCMSIVPIMNAIVEVLGEGKVMVGSDMIEPF